MDAKPEVPVGKDLETKKVILPTETARALGRGLSQLLNEPTAQIKPYIDNLKNDPGVDQEHVQAMETAVNKILAILDKFEHAREIKIVPIPGGLDFAFSEERETGEQPPIQSEIIIDDTTTPTLHQLNVTMQHNFNNSFVPLIGYPEMIEASTNDPTVKQQAAQIALTSQSMLNDLNLIQNADHQLRISTTSDGTTITPVQPALINQTI